MAGRVCTERYAKIAKEGQRILLKKKWDPAALSLSDQKMVTSEKLAQLLRFPRSEFQSTSMIFCFKFDRRMRNRWTFNSIDSGSISI